MRPNASASSKTKNILVAVSGQTPAIVTETLWALERQQNICIDEIRVITTTSGRQSILSRLIGPDGAFERYCREYDIPHGRIAFSEKNVHVIQRHDGTELEDIRSSRDNMAAADQVFSLIRKWTAVDGEALYCSVAGGRKTLGIYLTMSLMLCGRPCDSLSHVLVAPEFETGVPDFFFPPRRPRLFRRFVGYDESRTALFEDISSERAQVELADIPFPRLREAIGGELPLDRGLTEAVAHSQSLLGYLQAPPPLILHLDQCSAQIGNISFRLSRQLIAVYAFFLFCYNGQNSLAGIEALFDRRLLIADLERAIDRLRLGERESYAWDQMSDVFEFRSRIGPCISKVNRAVDGALGRNRLSSMYRITTGGIYGVNIPAYEVLERDGRPWEPSPK